MDRELLKEISAVSEFYEDITIDKYEIPLLFTGMNGVYVCIPAGNSDSFDTELYTSIRNKLGLRDTQIFLFRVASDDAGCFYDYINGFTAMENIYEAYQNCYVNHLIPQTDLYHITFDTPASYCEPVNYEPERESYEEDADTYVLPIISEKLIVSVEQKLVDIQNAPVQSGNYRTYLDGHMEVKRTVTQSVAGISTFVESGTAYFPCMDMDGDKFFMLTFLGGLFGVHKFKTGNYLKGLFYLLTCGCAGVFYVLDLVSILLGGYNYSMIVTDKSRGTVEFQKKRFYSKPLQNKKKAALLILAAIAVAFVVVTVFYIPVLDYVNVFVSSLLSDTGFAEDLANSMLNQ